jgi:hypothetical protein
MPIRELRDTDIDQECAKCGTVRTLPLSAVEVGIVRDNQANSKIVPLPPCAGCGATEFLVRSPDGEEYPAPGNYGHLHRLLVDELHTRLVKTNRVANGIDARTVATKEPTAETMGRYFPGGLKLPPPPKTDGGTQ